MKDVTFQRKVKRKSSLKFSSNQLNKFKGTEMFEISSGRSSTSEDQISNIASQQNAKIKCDLHTLATIKDDKKETKAGMFQQDLGLPLQEQNKIIKQVKF